MDMQGALRARLVAAALPGVGSRIYWVDRPQGSALPAITLQTISGERPQTHDGFQGLRSSRVQMDVWATSYAQARQITDAAVAALAPDETSNGVNFGRMFFEGERDLLERIETQAIHRTSIDLIVWHSPA